MKKLISIFFLLLNINSLSEEFNIPRFQLRDLEKVEHSNEKYFGENMLLVFWVSWCENCQNFLETLKEIYEENNGSEKELVILTFNNEEKEVLKKYLKDKNYSFPIINDEKIFRQFLVQAYPTIIVVDREGKIIKYIEGNIEKKKLLNYIKE